MFTCTHRVKFQFFLQCSGFLLSIFEKSFSVQSLIQSEIAATQETLKLLPKNFEGNKITKFITLALITNLAIFLALYDLQLRKKTFLTFLWPRSAISTRKMHQTLWRFVKTRPSFAKQTVALSCFENLMKLLISRKVSFKTFGILLTVFCARLEIQDWASGGGTCGRPASFLSV